MSYTNDLDGFIENMKDIEKSASVKDDRGLLMMSSFARKTAEDFRDKGKESQIDVLNLRDCVDNERGIWPDQLRQSGVRFWNGTKITIDEFKKECKRQGYEFKVQ